MKIVIISDTHAGHEALGTLSGDVLIHCGDFGYGRDSALGEARRLDAWFQQQSFGLILCTGGNHDFGVEESIEHRVPLFRHATYLQDSGVVFGGVRFYGAPWVPQLRGWAHYQGHTGLKEKWARIPADTDVLITHTPPYGILDTNSRGHQCGCEHLLERLEQVRPRLHCFGHVHASAGVHEAAGTTYVNASIVNSTYQVVRAPFEVEL